MHAPLNEYSILSISSFHYDITSIMSTPDQDDYLFIVFNYLLFHQFIYRCNNGSPIVFF